MNRRLLPWPALLLLACGAAIAADATPTAERGTAPVTVAPTAAGGPASAEAAAPAAAPPYAARLRAQTRQVLAEPDFRQRETVRYPVPRDWLRKLLQKRDAKPTPTSGPDLRLLATVFQYLAVLLLALGLAWLLWRGWQWLAPLSARRTPERGGRVADVRHLALPDAPLPDTIAAAARAAWSAGNAALALSLLYRGAVRDLARRHGIELPDSATEGECLRLARQSGAAVVTAGFAPIVQAWMALAYARRVPADFESLVALYARHFEAPPGEPA